MGTSDGHLLEGLLLVSSLGTSSVITPPPHTCKSCIPSPSIHSHDACMHACMIDEAYLSASELQEIIDDFNRQNIIKQTIYLNHPSVWVFTAPGEFQGQKNFVEPYINDFQKFNSNSGMAIGPEGPTWSSVMQALSHYSYHVSGGQYVLCDLQGGIVKSECEFNGNAILTDPVILSRDREYGITDLGLEGISTFFGRYYYLGHGNHFDRQSYVHAPLHPWAHRYEWGWCAIVCSVVLPITNCQRACRDWGPPN